MPFQALVLQDMAFFLLPLSCFFGLSSLFYICLFACCTMLGDEILYFLLILTPSFLYIPYYFKHAEVGRICAQTCAYFFISITFHLHYISFIDKASIFEQDMDTIFTFRRVFNEMKHLPRDDSNRARYFTKYPIDEIILEQLPHFAQDWARFWAFKLSQVSINYVLLCHGV